MLARLLLLGSLVAGAAAEDTLQDQLAQTDLGNVDQVLALAQWCTDHHLYTHAHEYYARVIRLDPDNETAHTALNQIKVGDRWVARPRDAADTSGSAAPGGSGSASPPPTAAEIPWQYDIPRDPQPDNDFLNTYINKLPSIANDSTDMDNAVATFLMDENLPSAIPRLCKALARPDYNDCYGAANLVQQLSKNNRLETARPLLPFLVKATTHVTDAEDLAAAVFSIGLFKDKRALPRIIELFDNADPSVKEACSQAVSMITALPPPVTKAQAQAWWNHNHDADPHVIFLTQLRNPDPRVEIAAAEALYDLRDKSIFPVLVRLLAVDDRDVNNRAILLVKRMIGLDFNYSEATTTEERAKRAQLAEKWWKDNGDHFRFPDSPEPSAATPVAPPPTIADQAQEWVGQLGSVVGATDTQAETNLRAAGLPAVPALIAGLDNAAPIIRRRCNEILKTITHQDFGFDPRGSDDSRAKAVAQWKAWADAHVPSSGGAGGGGDSDK